MEKIYLRDYLNKLGIINKPTPDIILTTKDILDLVAKANNHKKYFLCLCEVVAVEVIIFSSTTTGEVSTIGSVSVTSLITSSGKSLLSVDEAS